MLSRPLAETLGVGIGDNVAIEVQEGKRPLLQLQLVKLSEDILGSPP